MTRHQKEILYKKIYNEKVKELKKRHCDCSYTFCMLFSTVSILSMSDCKSITKRRLIWYIMFCSLYMVFFLMCLYDCVLPKDHS